MPPPQPFDFQFFHDGTTLHDGNALAHVGHDGQVVRVDIAVGLGVAGNQFGLGNREEVGGARVVHHAVTLRCRGDDRVVLAVPCIDQRADMERRGRHDQ